MTIENPQGVEAPYSQPWYNTVSPKLIIDVDDPIRQNIQAVHLDQWEKMPQSTEKEWSDGKRVVSLLYELGQAWEFIKNDISSRCPYFYNVRGVLIAFLPHWNHYQIMGKAYPLPQTVTDIERDIKDFQEYYRSQYGRESRPILIHNPNLI